MADLQLIKKVIYAPGISGRENKIREIIKDEIASYVDSVTVDNMGNLIAFKKGTAPDAKKLMLAGHMDEIGFLVTFIEEKGFIRVAPIGGISWGAVAFTTVLFENGIHGVIVPEAQVSANDYNAGKFYIDIGATNKKDAEKRVKIGDFAIMEPSLVRLANRRYAGHPMDDRIGCAVMIEACKNTPVCVNDTYFVFTVQEEVGLRGAVTSSFGVMPDYAVAFDVTRTGDVLNSPPMMVSLGDGAAIKIKDSSVLCDIDFVETLKSLAKDNKIKYQMEILEAGGTDTAAMQTAGSGSKAGAVSIPTRYIHSGVEMIDLSDYEACVKLTISLLGTEL
jgi:Cellulase M and related proteins